MTLRLKITQRVIVKKNSQRILRSPSGKTFIAPSTAYERFKRFAKAEILDQQYGMKFTTPVRINYTFYLKGKLDADLDNIVASVNDVLMDANLLEDDSLITEITATKIANCRAFETEITIDGI